MVDARRMRSALRVFMNVLVSRCVRRWGEFVDEQKMLRKALSVFTSALVMRCIRKWSLYVETRREKFAATKRGQEFWESKSKIKVFNKLEKLQIGNQLWSVARRQQRLFGSRGGQ